MSILPIFVEYHEEGDKQLFQVPVVCFDPINNLAIIVHKKEFIKVKLEDIKFSRWDI